MTTAPSPEIAAYVAAFSRSARRLNLKEAEDIARDVRQHIEEALQAGEAWPSIRAKLGAPDALAKAYAAELMFGDDREQERRPGNFLTLFSLATGGGVLTLIVVVFLGSIALTFVLSALVILAVCLPIALGGPTPPYVQLDGVPAWAMVLIGTPLFGVIGWASFRGLASYLRWFAGSLRRALPQRRT